LAQAEHREWPVVFLVGGIERDAGAAVFFAPVGTNDASRQNHATGRASTPDDGAGEVLGGFAGALTRCRTAQPDLIGVRRLPVPSVGTMRFRVGPLPGGGPLTVAVRAGFLRARGGRGVSRGVVERLCRAAASTTFSKNQLVCS
jgi:hypothetical protein